MTLDVLDASGTWYQIGVSHGRQKAPVIHQTVREGIPLLSRQWDLGEKDALARLDAFLPFFKAAAPHLLEEIQGIADGAGISFAHALYLNVRHDLKCIQAAAGHTGIGCTSFAAGREATLSRSGLAGQNKDTTPVALERLFLLRIRPDRGPAILGLVYPGEVGPIGLNSAGVAVLGNALYPRQWPLGCPHNLTRRILLEQSSLDGCDRVLRAMGTFSPANVTLADREGRAACFELMGARIGRIDEEGGLAVHANHVRHPELCDGENFPDRVEQSVKRQDRLQDLLAKSAGRLTPQEAMEALKDHEHRPHSICRHQGPINGVAFDTTFALVCDLKDAVLHLAKGHPCQNAFEPYPL